MRLSDGPIHVESNMVTREKKKKWRAEKKEGKNGIRFWSRSETIEDVDDGGGDDDGDTGGILKYYIWLFS